MYHIDKDNIDEFWGLMSPGLSRALIKTYLGQTWDLPSAYERVKSGGLFGFYEPETKYSGLYMITDTPLARILYWFWSGKDESYEGIPNGDSVSEYLDRAAKVFQCKYIHAEGRSGFKHLAKALGYHPDSNTWLKEVI